MQKGLGIAALVIAIIAIFIPLFGAYVTVISGVLAACAYGSGLAFGVSSIVINLINIFVLSPSIVIRLAANSHTESVEMVPMSVGEPGEMVAASATNSGETLLTSVVVLILVQIVSAVVLVLLHRKKSRAN
jgi:hypothetical protein